MRLEPTLILPGTLPIACLVSVLVLLPLLVSLIIRLLWLSLSLPFLPLCHPLRLRHLLVDTFPNLMMSHPYGSATTILTTETR